VKQEFKGKNSLVASNNSIGNDMSGTRYDVGAGMVARMSENVSLFGRGSVETGGSTNAAGKASGGVNITW
jgi:autotransporter family porin